MEQPEETPTSRLAISWERRYAEGRDSGAGSRGELAQAKADYVNALIEREKICSVIDWGCGDGAQLALLKVPLHYLGVDVSPTAIALCKKRHPGKRFMVSNPDTELGNFRGELSLSMDVVFHLVRDADYRNYMRRVFHSATRFVCIFGTNEDRPSRRHMRHREWTGYVAKRFPSWRLVVKPDSDVGFFLLQKRARS